MNLKNIYATPESLPEPEFGDFMNKGDGHRFDNTGYFEAIKNHRKELAEWCQQQHRNAGGRANKLIGKTIAFPIADGRAEYMIYSTSPLQVIHLNYGDGYQASDITMRGLRLADVKQMVAQDEKLAEIFGRS